MKTYLVNTGNSQSIKMVAVLAENKSDAFEKVKLAKGSAIKSVILVSSCHIDYVTCEKI